MNMSKFFRLMLIAGIMMLYGVMVMTYPAFATDQTTDIQPQEQPVQSSEANPKHEPEQIEEPEQINPVLQAEEQQPNEPDEIEQAAPPLNQ